MSMSMSISQSSLFPIMFIIFNIIYWPIYLM